MFEKIRKFWAWYDEVPEPRRMIYFMAPALVVLLVIPLFLYRTFGIEPVIPQAVGTLFLLIIGMTKEL